MYLKQFDLFFSYKFVFRFLLINKHGLFFNTNQLPNLKQLIVFFDVINITNLNDKRSLNYVYFIRFFFGQKAFFSKIFSFFSLGTFFYSYKIFVLFFFRKCFFPLAVFINDFIGFSSDQFYLFKYYSFKGNSFFFTFNDMNIFLEKKNNMGFYYLKDPIKFKLLLDGIDFFSSSFLVFCFKF